MTAKLPPKSALASPEWELADASAIKACFAGTATAEQQIRVMDVIVRDLCRVYDMPYRPDKEGGDRDTAFACGRMFVGQEILKLRSINLDKLRRGPNG